MSIKDNTPETGPITLPTLRKQATATAHKLECSPEPPKEPKVLNSSEDVHIKGMSTFEVDEHLRCDDAASSRRLEAAELRVRPLGRGGTRSFNRLAAIPSTATR